MKEVLFPTTFQKIIHATQYTVFILGAGEKQFAIYTTPSTGEFVQRLFTNKPYTRPQTLDLLGSICGGLEIIPLQLVIHNVKEAIYYCKLFLTQGTNDQQKILEIDARPSDGLSLALIYNLPVYCTQSLLDNAENYSG